MSIENEIKKLTAAIENLTKAVIERPVIERPVIEEPVAEEPVAEEPVVEEPVIEEPVVEEVSYDMIKGKILAISRGAKGDKGTKDRLKALLSGYSASKVADLDPSTLEEVMDRLESGEY